MKLPVSRGTRAYLLVIAALMLALLVITIGWWRGGLVFFGLALLVAAVVRFVFSEDQLGLLKVRSRWLDVSWLSLLGGSLVLLALVVPPSVL